MKTKTNRMIQIAAIALATIFVASCKCDPKSGLNDNTPTRGKTKIGVDESFSLLSDAEIYTFQQIYDYATITTIYKPETDIINDFLNDSVQVIVTARKLNKEQEEYFKSKNIFPKTVTIAYDGLAFIVNKNNKDSFIRYDALRDVFLGKNKTWNQLNGKGSATPIKVVFDNNKSSNVRFISEKFNLQELPKNCYAVEKNDEVVNYVETHPDALGVVSVNWISDKDDSVTRGFLKRIKVVAITSDVNSDGENFYRPYQGYIADKSYPFIREVYMINRELYTGLGSGFLQFVAGEKGQRIVLKMGMVPATMPVRLIKTRDNF